MQGDALITNNANRLAFRSSASAAGVHSVEGSFGDGVPITYSASAVCTRAATSNTNGLEPTVQSTLGLGDIPNAFSDAVRPVANQIGEEIPQIFVTSTIPSGVVTGVAIGGDDDVAVVVDGFYDAYGWP
ncbi:hypothetical protein F0562_025478 [Nyssa sinensis]|uniref:Uncharacterized protein n=1 Tax=Nyssa sinensis TaxID=561372 RepID=A0A5J5B8W2_9ASTE|nr:hypothetical protein F0562_025478 [Nyssa sinensis]